MIGISVYLNDINYEYIETARNNGVNEIFTSFKMIEEDYQQLALTAKELIEYCNHNQMKLIADVDEKSAIRFGLNSLLDFKNIGLSNVRIDGGVTNQEIAKLSNQFTVYLNASDIKAKDIEQQLDYGLKIKNCVAMHNFYPLENTGLSEQYFIESNKLFKSFGMKVLAFIPGDKSLRGPVYNGLPTLERDRGVRPLVAYLKMKELVDQVFIGDIEISSHELALINGLPIIELNADFITVNELDGLTHEIRPDFNETLIRIIDRGLLKPDIEGYIRKLIKGSIIVQNTFAIERYQGEVQIMKKELPSDRTKTVIGHISTNDLVLLDLIKPEYKIKFRKRND